MPANKGMLKIQVNKELKHCKKAQDVFKIDKKDTRTIPLTSFWCLHS